ncbi:MAG TPA: 3-oxoacyl-[acyl-carrier-protein] reductase [Bacillota bacterium]|nr:3-oxoacyl-[acyl-carrier-protein] reductase [Bacillota bacterium]
MGTAIVTGGTGGIGQAICRGLADSGHAIAVHYAGNHVAAEQLVCAIIESGGQAAAFQADICDEAQVIRLFEEVVGHFGSVDILVNNAGITRDGLVLRMELADWQRVLDTNLTGAFLASKAAARIMLRQRSGRIINIASVVGIMGNAGQANYAASKAGLIGLTKSLAKELASRGITCNAVAPGFINAGMAADLPQNVKDSYLSSIPLGKAGTPRQVAQAVCFLAGADYITGQVIRVDGGMNMS